jgi:molecular chaperone GrpE
MSIPTAQGARGSPFNKHPPRESFRSIRADLTGIRGRACSGDHGRLIFAGRALICGLPNFAPYGDRPAMTDTTARASDTAPPEQTCSPETAPDPMAALTQEAAQAREEAAEYKDRLLRALAEMENLRRRTEREVADVRSYGIASFARELLAVADNMRRALDVVSAELRASAGPGLLAFLDGVELTERELLKTLEKHGVTRLEPLGQRFDPNLHQAMFEVPDPAVPSGTVVQVVQPGYRIGERVLRPAMVAVAKGGPKLPKEVTANDNVDGLTDQLDEPTPDSV